jgi:hypothetical protein
VPPALTTQPEDGIRQQHHRRREMVGLQLERRTRPKPTPANCPGPATISISCTSALLIRPPDAACE